MRSPLGVVRSSLADPLLRNATALMANTAVTSGLAFVFWSAAAHVVPPAAIGLVTASVSACTLLATAGSLGLPNTVVLHLPARAARGRSLVSTALAATAGATVLTLIATWWTPFRVPLGGVSGGAAVVVALLVATAGGAVLDAATLAARRAELILMKNAVCGVVRLGLLLLPAPPGVSPALAVALVYLAGALVGVGLSVWVTYRLPMLAGPRGLSAASLGSLWRFSTANHLGMVVGILPTTLSPLLVLHLLGGSAAAFFGVALMLLTGLTMIPSAISQSLFAESGHGGQTERQVRTAALRIAMMLVPAVVVIWVVAPVVLPVFGPDYRAAVPVLRLMALGTLPAAVNYLADVYVNGRGDGVGYLWLNLQNALLVVGGVEWGARHGLVAVGLGWAAAQTASAVVEVGYAVRTRRRVGSGRPASERTPTGVAA